MDDVFIIGGGIIGLTLALELAEQQVSVTVVDQGPLGQEASWAGAGMLPPGNPQYAPTPEAQLRAGSHVLWSALSARLREQTGIDNGYRETGGLELRFVTDSETNRLPELEHDLRTWRAEHVEAQPLTSDELREREPGLGDAVAAGYFLPTMGQVRNPRHLKALMAACVRRGVTLLPGTPVNRFERVREKVVSAETGQGKIAAGQFVIASGAWSSRLLAEAGCRADVRPIRGQMLLVSLPGGNPRHVLNVGPRYVVPRPDGRILIGATQEDVGFDKRNTAEGVGGLLQFGSKLFPGLGRATYERCWAGFRPGTPDHLPLLGGVPGSENLYVATGHFRSGLQMSPFTAKLMSDLILGRTPSISLEPFAPDRFNQESRVTAHR